VIRAGRAETPGDEAARADLCRLYWRPIYNYLRRSGYPHEDAQELTQEFFARLLEKNWLQAANQRKGKFRSYLLLLLKRFLADRWDHAHRLKRGGGQPPIALDATDTSVRARIEPLDELTPDKLFDRTWAESLLERALQALRDECQRTGKSGLFDALHPFITCEQPAHYAETASRLGLSENYIKVIVHRMRQRWRELVREEIARTARSPEEVEDASSISGTFQDLPDGAEVPGQPGWFIHYGEHRIYFSRAPQTIAYFRALSTNGVALVLWRTAEEVEIRSFDLFQWVLDTGWVKVNPDPIPARNPAGAVYALVNPYGETNQTCQFRLVANTTDGEETWEFERTITEFAFSDRPRPAAEGVELRWFSRQDETYDLLGTPDLNQPLSVIVEGVPATPPENVLVLPTNAPMHFFRLRLAD